MAVPALGRLLQPVAVLGDLVEDQQVVVADALGFVLEVGMYGYGWRRMRVVRPFTHTCSGATPTHTRQREQLSDRETHTHVTHLDGLGEREELLAVQLFDALFEVLDQGVAPRLG